MEHLGLRCKGEKMQIWVQDESDFIDVFNDFLITKDLGEEIYQKFGSRLIYDLRDLDSMQLIESIDFLNTSKELKNGMIGVPSCFSQL